VVGEGVLEERLRGEDAGGVDQQRGVSVLRVDVLAQSRVGDGVGQVPTSVCTG